MKLVELVLIADVDVSGKDSSTPGTPLVSASKCFEIGRVPKDRDALVSHLIGNADFDMKLMGGLYGLTSNAACLTSTSSMSRLGLAEWARSYETWAEKRSTFP